MKMELRPLGTLPDPNPVHQANSTPGIACVLPAALPFLARSWQVLRVCPGHE